MYVGEDLAYVVMIKERTYIFCMLPDLDLLFALADL